MRKLSVSIILAVTVFYGESVRPATPYQPDKAPGADASQSTRQGVRKMADAIDYFALDIYHQLRISAEGNIFYSPYSIFSALAIVWEGARGKTEAEMREVLHIPPAQAPGADFASIYNSLNRTEAGYELHTGNALWLQRDFPFLEDYLKTVQRYYAAKVANLDFVRETEKSRQIINRFIAEQTREKIKELLARGSLNKLTRLVITNAIYFKGLWKRKFDKKRTREMDFRVSSARTVKAQMMFMRSARFRYADLSTLQILELPYRDGTLSMLVLLPGEGLAELESSLTLATLSRWKSRMKETVLDAVYLPKFELRTKYDLSRHLVNMGMATAFGARADFSGMTDRKGLFINFVIHQAYAKVDEEGTEATGATAVGIGVTSLRARKIFRADHPFIFLIEHRETGTILFIGRLVNPAEA